MSCYSLTFKMHFTYFQPLDLKHPLHLLPLCMTVLGCTEHIGTHVGPLPAREQLQGLWKQRAKGSPASTQTHLQEAPLASRVSAPWSIAATTTTAGWALGDPHVHPAQPMGSMTAPCPKPQALPLPLGCPLVLCYLRGTTCCSSPQPTHTDFIPAQLVSPGCHKHPDPKPEVPPNPPHPMLPFRHSPGQHGYPLPSTAELLDW